MLLQDAPYAEILSGGKQAIREAQLTTTSGAAALAPYLPRLVREWIRDDPGQPFLEVEGTLCFVDISGFTAMSERLSSRGKAGAEEVTEIMNATFEPLLNVGYEYGGSVLKFGGDALLLFYWGDQHAARACRAAFEMRSVLRERRQAKTSAGQVTLRMHVGVNSGRFHFFLVGTEHRELIVTGPEATRAVLMESTAEAGEILVARGTARMLDAAVLGERKGEGRLLRSAPAAGLSPEPVDEDPPNLFEYVPLALRTHLSQHRIEPEHRQAAVAFLRFSGSDRFLEQDDPQGLSRALEGLVSAVQTAAAEHGVCFLETDVDSDGGRIILVSGVPETAGQDEERLLRAVLAATERAGELDLRIGVNRGRVFAGEVGTAFRRTYTILGDTAALAARLMARADSRQVLAAAEVLKRSQARFELDELEPFHVKGKTEKIVAFAVRGISAPRREAEQRVLPLVGREREQALLGAAIAPVRAGFGSFVELVGEPGIGKSRLVLELRGQCADMAVQAARCEQYESSTPYYAFRDILRPLIALQGNGDRAATTRALRAQIEPIAPHLVPWLPLLAIPLDLDVESTTEVEELDPAFRRLRLNAMVIELLAALLPSASLIVLEDVHWMDDASADLLRSLGEQITSKPWLICATRRPVETGFAAAEGIPAITLRLEPLSADAAKALAAAASDNGLVEAELAAIAQRAGGNPLFVEELVGAATAEAEAEVEELPENVEGMVVARIDRLAPPDRAVLRYASVIGQVFSVRLVEEILEGEESQAIDPESWSRLADFVRRDPYEPDSMQFKHALFRDAAYEGLSFRRRRQLHGRVAAAYEREHGERSDEYAEILSLHFLRAEEFEPAWQYSLVAGTRAQDKFANADAAEFYRRALEAARGVKTIGAAEVAQVWEALGDVSELAGRYGDAAEAYRHARKLAPPDRSPALLLKEGVICERSGRYSDALRWYTRGLREAERVPDERTQTLHRIELSLAYAGVRYRQGKFHDSVTWCERILDDAHRLGHLPGLAHAYYLLHVDYTSLGDSKRDAFRGLSLPIYEELGDLLGQANVLNNLGIDAYYEGRWTEALDLYERSREARRRIGDVVGAATITNNIAEIKVDQGHLAEAEELFKETHSVCEAAGNRLLALVAQSNLARVAARSGRLDEAISLLQTAVEGFREIGAGSFVLEAEARLAECSLLAGNHVEALRQASEALARSLAGGSAVLQAMLYRLRGYALLHALDARGAEESFEESLRCAERAGAEYELALTLDARARLTAIRGGSPEEDEERSRAIVERLEVISTPDIPLPR